MSEINQNQKELNSEKYDAEFVIAFADWLDKLTPTQKVSVWSKNGEATGLFTMDNEQLFDKFKRGKL